MMELFPEYEKSTDAPPPPLADRMRPESWEDLLGHEHLIGERSPLRRLSAKPPLPGSWHASPKANFMKSAP